MADNNQSDSETRRKEFYRRLDAYRNSDLESHLLNMVLATNGFEHEKTISSVWESYHLVANYTEILELFQSNLYSNKRRFDSVELGQSADRYVPVWMQDVFAGFAPTGNPNSIFTLLSVALCLSTKYTNIIRFMILGLLIEMRDQWKKLYTRFPNTSPQSKYTWSYWDFALSAALVYPDNKDRPRRFSRLNNKDWENFNCGTLFHLYMSTFLSRTSLLIVEPNPQGISTRYTACGHFGTENIDEFMYVTKVDTTRYCLLLPEVGFSSEDGPQIRYRYELVFLNENDHNIWCSSPTERLEIPSANQISLKTSSRSKAVKKRIVEESNVPSISSTKKRTRDTSTVKPATKVVKAVGPIKSTVVRTVQASTSRGHLAVPPKPAKVVTEGPGKTKYIPPCVGNTQIPVDVYEHINHLYKFYVSRLNQMASRNVDSTEQSLLPNEYEILRFIGVHLKDDITDKKKKTTDIWYSIEWKLPHGSKENRQSLEPSIHFKKQKCSYLFARFVIYYKKWMDKVIAGESVANLECPTSKDLIAGGSISQSTCLNKSLPSVNLKFKTSVYYKVFNDLLLNYSTKGNYILHQGFYSFCQQILFYKEIQDIWSRFYGFDNSFFLFPKLVWNRPKHLTDYQKKFELENYQSLGDYVVLSPVNFRKDLIDTEGKPVIFILVSGFANNTIQHCVVGIYDRLNDIGYFDPISSKFATKRINHGISKIREVFNKDLRLTRCFGEGTRRTTKCYIDCLEFIAELLSGRELESIEWYSNSKFDLNDYGF